MQLKKSTIKLSKALYYCIKLGYITSIIQFGSSLSKKNPNDIDIAVIIKKGCYEKFLKVVYGKSFKGFDISLIKQEEIGSSAKFRFGRHGAHFLYVLKTGRSLYGQNPFRKMVVARDAVRKSIISSLYDYMYDVRKAVFQGKIPTSVNRRKNKFIRLCLYLLKPSFKYPDVLYLDDDIIRKHLKKHNLILTSKNVLVTYERLWAKVLKKLNLCN